MRYVAVQADVTGQQACIAEEIFFRPCSCTFQTSTHAVLRNSIKEHLMLPPEATFDLQVRFDPWIVILNPFKENLDHLLRHSE